MSMEDRLYHWLDMRLSAQAPDTGAERSSANQNAESDSRNDAAAPISDEEAERLVEDAERADRCLELLETIWPSKDGVGRPTQPTAPTSQRSPAPKGQTPSSSQADSSPSATETDTSHASSDSVAGGGLDHPFFSGDSNQRLGRFEILRKLGHGGMGLVFLAHDPVMKRDIALKIPHGGNVISNQQRARFLQEARAAGILRHPNIVRVYETGEAEGVCFIASEYCNGPTLSKWIHQTGGRDVVGPRDVTAKADLSWNITSNTAVQICLDLAEALQHAHDRGTVHRDLKPSNVMMSTETRHINSTDAKGRGAVGSPIRPRAGETLTGPMLGPARPIGLTGVVDAADKAASAELAPSVWTTSPPPSGDTRLQPQITDFGLARLDDNDLSLTASGTTLGTAEYMPIEQAIGDVVGPAADQYALGIILYQLLTGVSPFRRESLATTLIAVQQDAAPSPRVFCPRLSRDLEAICLKAIAKIPGQRYDSAGDLADDLQRYLDLKPIQARPTPAPERIRRWARRNPGIAAGTAIALLATVIVFTVVTRTNFALTRINVALERSLDRANQLQREADDSRLKAERQAKLAAERELEARQISYLSDMKLASQAASKNHWTDVASLLQRQVPGPGAQDLRDMEWHALDHQVRRRILHTAIHPMAVNEIALFPDGRRIATACEDGCVRIWNLDHAAFAESWKPEHVIQALSIGLHAVAVSPDGSMVAAAGRSWMPGATALTLWDTESGELKKSLHRHKTTIEAIQFSPNGDRVASSARHDCCRVWDLETNKSVIMNESDVWAKDLAFVNDQQLLSITDGEHLSKFDTATGAVTKSHNAARWLSIWQPEQIACAFQHGRISFIDIKTNQVLGGLSVDNNNPLRRLNVSDEGVIATAHLNGNFRCWQLKRTGKKVSATAIANHHVHRGELRDVVVMDETRVASVSVDGAMVISSYSIPNTPLQPTGVVDAVVYGDSQHLLFTDIHGRVVYRRLKSPQPAASLGETSADEPNRIDDGGGEQLPEDMVAVAGQPDIVIAHEPTLSTSLNVSFNECFGCATFESGVVMLIDLHAPDKPTWRMNTLDHEMLLMPKVSAVANDGRVYSANPAYKVGVWDVRRQTRIKTLPVGTQTQDLALTPDDGLLICGQDDIRVFDTQTFELKKMFSGANIVEAMDVSHDGTRCVTVHQDGAARIWLVDTMELELLLPAQTSASVVDVQFSDNDERIIVCDTEHIWIWHTASGDFIGSLFSSPNLRRISQSGDRLLQLIGANATNSPAAWLPIASSFPAMYSPTDPRATPFALVGVEPIVAEQEHSQPSRHLVSQSPVESSVFRNAQQLLLSNRQRTRAWTLPDGTATESFEFGAVTGVATFKNDERWICLTPDKVSLVDPQNKQELWSQTLTSPSVWEGATLSNDGAWAMLTDSDGRLLMFERDAEKPRWTVNRPEGGLTCLLWGDQVVWGGAFPYVSTYATENGLKKYEAYCEHHTYSLAVAGERLVTGHDDGVIRVWRRIDGQLRLQQSLPGHRKEVIALQVSANNQLISMCEDATLLWDLSSLRLQTVLAKPPAGSRFTSLGLAPDGRRAAAGHRGATMGAMILDVSK